MTKGRRILCRYVGDPMWHERVLVGQVGSDPGALCIVTLDKDVYVENYKGSDCAEVRTVPAGGGRPSGLTGKIHPFSFVFAPWSP